MWFIIATAFIITALFLAAQLNESMCNTLPMTASVTILTLYILAMFRSMKLIYILAALSIVFCVVFLKVRKVKGIAEKILHPGIITFFILSIVITILTKDQIFTWWDDINFWSSDAKQIYYLSGFPGKYGNVSPEFGDYPPVTSLFKWIFLQLSTEEYREGLQFAGYYILNATFLLPLLEAFEQRKGGSAEKWNLFRRDDSLGKSDTSGKNDSSRNAGCSKDRYLSKSFFSRGLCTYVAGITGAVLIFLVPGIVSGIVFYGTPADITMGIIYGALLAGIWDREGHSDIFYYGRIALYTAVLFLTKSVGIEWAIFALLFYFMTFKSKASDADSGIPKGSVMKFVYAAVFAGLFYGSWLLFCLINRRVAKATGLGIKMATGAYAVPANAVDKAKYFFLGMWTMPMHADHNLTFDPPIGVIILLIVLAFIVMVKRGIIGVAEKKAIGLFFLITGIITYGIIFIAHISLFQAEDQYLDAFAMTNSISRYGAPFILGGIYLLIVIALKRAQTFRAPLIIAAFILLTTDYTGMQYALLGYRGVISENKAYNEAMLDEGGMAFLNEIAGHRELWGHRVLNLRSDGFNNWVHDTYISKEASPVPVVYETLTKDDDIFSITEKIRASHAEYFYVDVMNEKSGEGEQSYNFGQSDGGEENVRTEQSDGDPNVVSDLTNVEESDNTVSQSNIDLWKDLTQGESFEYGKIYKVTTDGQNITLLSAW